METKFSPDAFFEFANLMLSERLKYAYYERYKDPLYLFYANFSFLKDCNYHSGWKLYSCESSWIANYYSLIKGEFENVTDVKHLPDNKIEVTYNEIKYCFGPYFKITDVYNEKTYNVSVFNPRDILYYATGNPTPLVALYMLISPVSALSFLVSGSGVVAYPYGSVNLLMVNKTGVMFKVIGGEIGATHIEKKTKTIP